MGDIGGETVVFCHPAFVCVCMCVCVCVCVCVREETQLQMFQVNGAYRYIAQHLSKLQP